jgi:hypothetical protein
MPLGIIVSKSLWVSAGCVGMEWVVDVIELIRPCRVKKSLYIRTRIPKSPKHDLKKWSKGSTGSEATRGRLNAAVCALHSASVWKTSSLSCRPPTLDFAGAKVP